MDSRYARMTKKGGRSRRWAAQERRQVPRHPRVAGIHKPQTRRDGLPQRESDEGWVVRPTLIPVIPTRNPKTIPVILIRNPKNHSRHPHQKSKKPFPSSSRSGLHKPQTRRHGLPLCESDERRAQHLIPVILAQRGSIECIHWRHGLPLRENDDESGRE
jgi:hypothetical protein